MGVRTVLDEILDCEVTLQNFMSNKQQEGGIRRATRGNQIAGNYQRLFIISG